MGVRGLTSFIAKHAELYLAPYELHDCNLVIDGDNLACNLYRDASGINSAFGGDYDAFYRTVVNFFVVLAECNINAYVLMDGGYEHRKLRTVGKRMRGKISVIKRINPCAASTVFPVMMKEVFVDAVKDCGIPVMRCVFEADDELAALSRKLKCPVLSYDSDFYIYNVKYIPLITLTVKAHTKYYRDVENGCQESRNLRKNEAKKVEKRTRRSRVMDAIIVDNKEKLKKGKSYKYLDCCIYRIENLIANRSLSKEKLPLFAAMLGNDYISRSSFKNFFLNGMGKIGRSRKTNQQQRRIKVILQWLKTETVESAMQKIMMRLQKSQRDSLMAQVEAATSGYSKEICRSFEFFKNHYENIFELIESDDEASYDDEVDTEEEEEDEYDSNAEEEFENEEELIGEDEAEECNEEEVDDCNEDSLQEKDSQTENDSSDGEAEADDNGDKNDVISFLPKWFLNKLYPANLPRFFVDLMYLRKYINNPQIEHFPFEDCHSIALPILALIYSLLNHVKGEDNAVNEMKDDNEATLCFTYLTRVTRVTNVIYKQIDVIDKPKYDFIPENPNPLFLRTVFDDEAFGLNSDELFTELDSLPEDIKLYFLAIVYWLQKSHHYEVVHLHALIVCLVVLRTIDSKVPPERDPKIFQKKFGKIIKKERQIREKEMENGLKRKVKEELLTLPVPERLVYVTKSDCLLVQNELLKHFHMQDVFKKKYELYSSTILHAFAEFQSIVFQLHSLNALIDFPYPSPRMGQLYCGVFLYNLYDILKSRPDIEYYIRSFIFKDSQMMFDFYLFLWRWCEKFIPSWKQSKDQKAHPTLSKKSLRKKRQQARKDDGRANIVEDPNADMLSSAGEMSDEFVDLNNKFCTFLTITK